MPGPGVAGVASSKPPSLVYRGVVVLFLILLAAPILWVGVPRLVAASLALPGDTGAAQLNNGEMLTFDGFTRVVDSRHAALRWAPDPTHLRDLGTAYMMAAHAPHIGVDREAALRAAVERYEYGLALEPVNPHGWVLLAMAHATLEEHDRAVAALERSFEAGPHAAELAATRVTTAMASWDHLGVDLTLRIRLILPAAMRRHAEAVVQTALETGLVNEMRLSLLAHIDVLQRFETLLEAARAAEEAAEEEEGMAEPAPMPSL